jgi:hypothetical protein
MGLLKHSLLMATFPIRPHNVPPPFVAYINMILTHVVEIHESYDPWIVLSSKECLHYCDQIPLSPMELAYQAIQSTYPSPHSLFDMTPDPFHTIFTIDEMIMEIMSVEETPWDDGHDCSILFLESNTIKSYQQISNPSSVINIPPVSKPTPDVLYEGNLGNISPTVPLDISIILGIMENVHIGSSCYPNEI